MENLIQFLSETGLPEQMLLVVGTVVTGLVGRYYHTRVHETLKESFAGELYEVVLQGAHATYQGLYQRLKEKAADGTLSRADVSALSEEAYRHAMAAAEDPKTKEALKSMTDHAWELLLKRAVNDLKSHGREASSTPTPVTVVPPGV